MNAIDLRERTFFVPPLLELLYSCSAVFKQPLKWAPVIPSDLSAKQQRILIQDFSTDSGVCAKFCTRSDLLLLCRRLLT